MIDNATLLEITPRTGVAADGTEIFGSTTGYGLPCTVGGVTSAQKFTLGATIQDVDVVLYLFKQNSYGIAPNVGDLLLYEIAGESAATAQIVTIGDLNLDSLSHWELYLKKK